MELTGNFLPTCDQVGKAEFENATLQKPPSDYVISQNAFERLDLKQNIL